MWRLAAVVVFTAALGAQPPEFENSYLRVRRVALDGKAESAAQWQPQRLFVPLTPAHLRIAVGEGAPIVRKLAAGDAVWLAAGEATIRNLSGDAVDAWMVEFKGDAAKPVVKSRTPDRSETVLIENSRARVLRARIAPGEASAMHQHPDRLILPLSEQRSRTTFADGAVEDHERRSGQVLWAAANAHATANTGETSLESIFIETKPAPLSADLQGIKLHYTDQGAGARTIVLIHGWTGDSTVWAEQVAALAARFRVITLDLPGHGRSEAPELIRYTPSLFADAVAAVCRAAAVRRVVVAGHSMGVTVARETWRKHRGLVDAFIGVDGFFIRPENIAGFREWGAQWDSADFRKKQDDFIRAMFTASASKAVVAATLKTAAATPRHAALSAIASMADPRVHNLDVIGVPGLLIFSSGPSSTPESIAFHKARFENVEIDVWQNAGHFPMLEQPERLNRKLIEFLDKLPTEPIPTPPPAP